MQLAVGGGDLSAVLVPLTGIARAGSRDRNLAELAELAELESSPRCSLPHCEEG